MKLRLLPRSRWAQVLLGLIILLLLPYVVSRIASPWRCVRIFSETSDKPSLSTTCTIRVVSYNIAHGRGLADSNWNGGSPEKRLERLEQIAQLLKKLDADVVVLNEVDFDSSWSSAVNQAEYLARKADYPYRVEQRNYDFRVLGWKWRFGNAVLSRYPIQKAQVVPFPGYSRWETLLAGKKQGLFCTIDGPTEPFSVLAAHLSYRSESLRVQSAKMIVELTKDQNRPLLLAGDLNSTPPGYPQACQDNHGENAITCLDTSQLFKRLPNKPPTPEQLTFSSSQPQTVIDWIMAPTTWNFENYQAIDSRLSDHRPVMAIIGRTANRPPE